MKFKAVLLLILFMTSVGYAGAQTMSNGSFILRMGNLNTSAGKQQGSAFRLNTTVGQTGPGLYSGPNYKVRAGFQYYPGGNLFSLTVSNTLVDFGVLLPTNPVTRETELTVNNPSASNYSVTAQEDHPMTNASGVSIPDTTCDNGKCSEASEDTWRKVLTYGFGFRCESPSNLNYCTGFTSEDGYKQFANSSSSEKAQKVMGGQLGTHKARILYKVNVSVFQAPGSYGNRITYVAIPSY